TSTHCSRYQVAPDPAPVANRAAPEKGLPSASSSETSHSAGTGPVTDQLDRSPSKFGFAASASTVTERSVDQELAAPSNPPASGLPARSSSVEQASSR